MNLVEKYLPTAHRLRWLFLCMGLFAAFCVLFSFVRDKNREKKESGFREASRGLVAGAEIALERNNFADFLAQSKAFVAKYKAKDVSIYNLQQDCIFHSFYEKPSYSPSLRGSVQGAYASKSVKNSMELSWYVKDSGPGDVFFFFPVRKAGTIAGTLQVQFRADLVYGTKGN